LSVICQGEGKRIGDEGKKRDEGRGKRGREDRGRNEIKINCMPPITSWYAMLSATL
jgi:hypothetical protein